MILAPLRANLIFPCWLSKLLWHQAPSIPRITGGTEEYRVLGLLIDMVISLERLTNI